MSENTEHSALECPCCAAGPARISLTMADDVYTLQATCALCESSHMLRVRAEDNSSLDKSVTVLMDKWRTWVNDTKDVFYAMEACERHLGKEYAHVRELLKVKSPGDYCTMGDKIMPLHAAHILLDAARIPHAAFGGQAGTTVIPALEVPANASYYQRVMRVIGILMCELERAAAKGSFTREHIYAVCPDVRIFAAPFSRESSINEARRFIGVIRSKGYGSTAASE